MHNDCWLHKGPTRNNRITNHVHVKCSISVIRGLFKQCALKICESHSCGTQHVHSLYYARRPSLSGTQPHYTYQPLVFVDESFYGSQPFISGHGLLYVHQSFVFADATLYANESFV